MRIFKYTIHSYGKSTIQLHKNSELLHVSFQPNSVDYEELNFWCLCDTEKPLIDVEFWIYPTGADIPDDLINDLYHVGTVVTRDGSFVLHVFIKQPSGFVRLKL